MLDNSQPFIPNPTELFDSFQADNFELIPKDKNQQNTILEFFDLQKIKSVYNLEQLPMRYKDETNYIYRKKGKPHIKKKSGEISIYYICMKCEKTLIFDWKTKSFITKESNAHTCKIEDHLENRKFKSSNNAEKLKIIEDLLKNDYMQPANGLFEKLSLNESNIFHTFNSFKDMIYKLREQKFPRFKEVSELMKFSPSAFFFLFIF